jgi:hypothetical protein
VTRSPQSPGTYTYLNHLDPSPGGRFAALAQRDREAKPSVIGSGPGGYPMLPASSPWHADPVPAEEPLDGTFCGNVFGEAMGEPHERLAEILPRIARRRLP